MHADKVRMKHLHLGLLVPCDRYGNDNYSKGKETRSTVKLCVCVFMFYFTEICGSARCPDTHQFHMAVHEHDTEQPIRCTEDSVYLVV